MAKGDSPNGVNGQPQAPKIDQYSVMHRLMDMTGGQSGMAPSMPQMGGRMNTMPMPMAQNGATDQVPMDTAEPGGFTGMMNGQIGQAPNSMMPTDPQSLLRRRMTGINSYGDK